MGKKAIMTANPAPCIAAAYYQGYDDGTPSPSQIDYSKFDVIFFAFATPGASSQVSLDSGSQSKLKDLVSCASKHKTKVVLSIGGWGGCKHYSSTMSSQGNRNTFVDSLSSTVNQYHLDGVDIDWEYPNNSGAGQPYSSKDSANFLLFLKALRSKLGSDKIISAAVTQSPWLGPDGQPLKDVSEFTKEMTYVNIMNYDVNSSSPHPGPNAPLGNKGGHSSQPNDTAIGSFKQWTDAGCPASKLLLGLPLYGYVSKSNATALSDIVESNDKLVGADLSRQHAISNVRDDVEGKAMGDLNKWYGQQIPFRAILAGGALQKSSDGTYAAANGYTRRWDEGSDTPFLYDTSRSTVVTYDDSQSLAAKAAYAKSVGMGGCFTWSLDQDDGTTLQSVIRTSLGI
ncbi:hypothetical protein HWV62_44159 [Athelia sp. TMB]|nr:hypothetical protein HWV62_44159 [Athelia sp. TMB]